MGTEAPAPAERIVPFEFRGSGAEYLRIWSVNLLLTIVTLGIYSAWAKVRRMRYFYGSTRLDGYAFEYHAAPLAILRGRLIAFALYVVYAVVTQVYPTTSLLVLLPIAFILPWVVLRSRKFHLRMSSWRGLRFDFHGDYRGALKAYVGWLLAAILTLYILFPVYLRKRISYVLGNSAYGSEQFRFTKGQADFWTFGLATVFLSLFLLLGSILLIIVIGGQLSRFDIDPRMSNGIWAVVVGAVIVLCGLAISAFYAKSVANAAFDHLGIGPHHLRSSLETGPLLWLYIKNFVLVVLTLGLYYPWAKVATVRYQLENTALIACGDLGGVYASASQGGTATGEEMSDIFDVDFGL